LEFRTFATTSILPTIGIAPIVTYDAVAGSYAVDFPVYLVSDGKNGLTGGVRFDWTSIKHVAVFGVFVSKAFNVGDFTQLLQQ
jgi:hypothetical protein